MKMGEGKDECTGVRDTMYIVKSVCWGKRGRGNMGWWSVYRGEGVQ